MNSNIQAGKIASEKQVKIWQSAGSIVQKMTDKFESDKERAILTQAIRQVREAVVVTDLQDRIIFVNYAFMNMYGYSREELIGNDIRILWSENTPPGSLTKVREATLEGCWQGEIFNQRKNGEEFPISLSTSVVYNDQYEPIALVGIISDITEQTLKEHDRKANEENLRRQQRLESIGTLASGIAHEINNPLTGIINYAQIIYDRMSDESLKEFAHGIMEEGERVAGIIRNLLTFSRQEQEGLAPARMSDIVQTAILLIETTLRKEMITLTAVVPEDLPKINCQAQQITQVIVNLLMNARDALNAKYSDYHEEKLIEMKSYKTRREDQCWLRTEILDHGIGIDEDTSGSVFDPFFTTKSRTDRSGLGLSVCYGIIKEHGGDIFMETEPGKYTRIYFDLPCLK